MAENVLYLDAATDTLMLAVSAGGELCARMSSESTSQRYHSAVLIPALQRLLDEAGIRARDLTAMAVNQGPGSFTGVRTGISTARTMGQFLDIPVHVISHFDLRAFDALARGDKAPVTVVLDALRGRLYAATVAFGPDGPCYRMEPAMVSAESWQPCPEAILLVQPSLLEALTPYKLRPFPADWFSPAVMQQLIARYPDFYRRTWAEIRPLYLQDPNITLRKAVPGRY